MKYEKMLGIVNQNLHNLYIVKLRKCQSLNVLCYHYFLNAAQKINASSFLNEF